MHALLPPSHVVRLEHEAKILHLVKDTQLRRYLMTHNTKQGGGEGNSTHRVGHISTWCLKYVGADRPRCDLGCLDVGWDMYGTARWGIFARWDLCDRTYHKDTS